MSRRPWMLLGGMIASLKAMTGVHFLAPAEPSPAQPTGTYGQTAPPSVWVGEAASIKDDAEAPVAFKSGAWG
jgi:hypothetical protein